MAGKVKTSSNKAFVSGGKGHMFGKQHAGPMVSGVTGKVNSGDGGKFAKGGTTKCLASRAPEWLLSGRSGKN
jgi:hypothetical protein